MGNPAESSDSSNPSGLTSLHNVQSEVHQLLEHFHAKGILGDSPEERSTLANEVGKLVNERLDAIEREKDPTTKAANMNNNNLAQDLRKSLGLVEEAPLHIDDRTFNELVSTKRTMYKPNYPHRTKEEFVPRDNPLRPVISPAAFLNLDCEKHASEKIDEWITMIRFTVKSGGYTPGGAYELCKATMVGNAQKYWESLIAHTPIKEEIDKEVFADGVLAIVVDALKREFCGFSLSTESLEKEQSLMALMKLQICDMCYFDNFACEFQKYYYNLDLAAQNYMSELFFAKLPDPWPEVAKTAFQLLLNEDKVVDGLGGRIQAVRYAMRKACTELQEGMDVLLEQKKNLGLDILQKRKVSKDIEKEEYQEEIERKGGSPIDQEGLLEKEVTLETKIG
ncbi:uncharacterized protein LOC126657048 [Mercurialis annua]|uniref:uncharacterized protein LOC126657048 n=1 Tax=Mercurialis annua TaxID=3986 RepID=UPI00215E2D77|nr:uncharacterized protein LOC126657048 [Mercurialis annua]